MPKLVLAASSLRKRCRERAGTSRASSSTLTSNGRTTIPKKIRDSLAMKPGERMTFIVRPDGSILLRPMTASRKTKAKSKRERFSRYDTADHLRTAEEIEAYLEAVLEEGSDDPSYLTLALGNVARAHGMMKLSQETALTREGLYKALSGNANPALGTVLRS